MTATALKASPPEGVRIDPVTLDNVSLILRTDSYKVTHWSQIPESSEFTYSYGESRGGTFPEVTFALFQPVLMNYLMRPITMGDIDYAEERFRKHFGFSEVFNRKGWEIIVREYGGYAPVRIKAVPEGTTVPVRNILFSIENTDPRLPWIANYLETICLKAAWYGTTVATISRHIKKLILRYLHETGTPESIDFRLHDFGYRGVSSEESAAYGGAAHLVNFKGTDNLIALECALAYYSEDMAGFSVPAAEHYTIMSWGRNGQVNAFRNMIRKFGHFPFYAVVSDTYNIYEAVEKDWGEVLRDEVLAESGTLVVRPDSGVPQEVVRQVVEILGRKFGFTTNDKGFKVLNKVRIIQGDGVDYEEIGRILEALKIRGWSADNVSFGMGGALLQRLDRDTQKFALKASEHTTAGKTIEIFKSPVGDNTKRSKPGRLKLVRTDSGLETYNIHDRSPAAQGADLLQVVYENGLLYNVQTFSEIRERANRGLGPGLIAEEGAA